MKYLLLLFCFFINILSIIVRLPILYSHSRNLCPKAMRIIPNFYHSTGLVGRI